MSWRNFLCLVMLSLLLVKIFTSAPASTSPQLYNPPRGDFRIVVISDLNSAYGSTTYEPEVAQGISLIPFWQPDLVLCAGDMIAGQKLELTNAQITAMWQAFDQQIAKPLRDDPYPFALTIGNHDASSAKNSQGGYTFARERELASRYWSDSQSTLKLNFVDSEQFPFYYTFEEQGVFFLVWDASSHQISPDQLAWVEESLASETAQQAKMRLVMGHLPLYGVSVGRDRPGEVMANADSLREILERYNVQTYISGHHHAYYPAHLGNLDLLHTGALGSGPKALISGDLPPQKTITVIDINFDSLDSTNYTTYQLPNLELIPDSQLPEFLDSHNGKIWRRDLRYSFLSKSYW